MRALLDTNIILHRETEKPVNLSIGTLFKWLDKAGYEKCIHPISITEFQKYQDKEKLKSLNIKLDSYIELKTIAPHAPEVQNISEEFDKNQNDRNDSVLLNEVFQERVDLLVSEDKKILKKAVRLGILDKVYSIDGFLEKVVSENPDLIDYNVLSVSKKYFGEIDLKDQFFESFHNDYQEFNRWFNKKSDETCYVTLNKGKILSFLYLKVETNSENYADIFPTFSRKRRLKIGTFKVVSNGIRLGERFLKIIFDNAIQSKVEEIYITIFNNSEDQQRLIDLLKDWGFKEHGTKQSHNGEELVLVRDFSPRYFPENPRHSFPYISLEGSIYLCPIYPQYHTELFPDSILTNESKIEFKEQNPHRNALRKVYISRSINRSLKSGDIVVFYRTGGYYRSTVTTIGIIESVTDNIKDEDEFILKCRKRSVFPDSELKRHWNYSSNRPFIVNFIYTYSFPKRPNMQKLIDLGVIRDVNTAPRGFEQISNEQFHKIIRVSESNESIIVN